jgi:hypothetical protein
MRQPSVLLLAALEAVNDGAGAPFPSSESAAVQLHTADTHSHNTCTASQCQYVPEQQQRIRHLLGKVPAQPSPGLDAAVEVCLGHAELIAQHSPEYLSTVVQPQHPDQRRLVPSP